jgi:hypothetical protein
MQLLGAEKTMGKIRIPVSDKNVDGQNQKKKVQFNKLNAKARTNPNI